jgi:hypothetical protein
MECEVRTKRVTEFCGPKGEPSTPEDAVQVVTRIYGPDGKQVAAITQTGLDWREEREVERRGCW